MRVRTRTESARLIRPVVWKTIIITKIITIVIIVIIIIIYLGGSRRQKPVLV